MKLLKTRSLGLFSVLGLFVAVKSAKAVLFAPAALYLILAALGLRVGLDLTSTPMSAREAFLYYLNPNVVEKFVYFEQEGDFSKSYAPYTDTALGLIDFRANLKSVLVDQQHQLTPEQFDAQYGSDDHPNFCAISKEAVTASFLMRFGGKAENFDISKHSRCVP